MDNINYLKHCTYDGDLENIIKSGYIISGLKAEKEQDFGNNSKIFLQIESYKYEHKSLDYGSHCILLNKKILMDRNDYVINNGYKGRVNKNSLKKPKKVNYNFIKSINPLHNEVIFNNKISLKKYMIGIKYSVNFDDKKDIRLDLIYEYKNFDIYSKLMKKIYNLNNLSELKKRYNKGQNILSLIKKYTDNIRFKYRPMVYFDNKTFP